jgi:hypothetical protein
LASGAGDQLLSLRFRFNIKLATQGFLAGFELTNRRIQSSLLMVQPHERAMRFFGGRIRRE